MVKVVLITAEAKDGERIGKTLVEERHAACVNIVPGLVSHYWWQGKMERADEVLLILKTKEDKIKGLIARAKELHPYSVPEILALKTADGNPDYLKWVETETRVR